MNPVKQYFNKKIYVIQSVFSFKFLRKLNLKKRDGSDLITRLQIMGWLTRLFTLKSCFFVDLQENLTTKHQHATLHLAVQTNNNTKMHIALLDTFDKEAVYNIIQVITLSDKYWNTVYIFRYSNFILNAFAIKLCFNL